MSGKNDGLGENRSSPCGLRTKKCCSVATPGPGTAMPCTPRLAFTLFCSATQARNKCQQVLGRLSGEPLMSLLINDEVGHCGTSPSRRGIHQMLRHCSTIAWP